MQLVEPIGHGDLLERLFRAAGEGRLPHALLLEGAPGIGKFQAAKWLASGLLCAAGPGRPCGSCGPCKRVSSGGYEGNHPDLFVLDPIEEGEERIRVARIAHRSGATDEDAERCVEVFLGLRAMEGRGRVVLIREGHRMNTSAQNALLKTLEEPSPGTLLVLETHRSEQLLTTIKSRCVRLRCAPLSRADCAEVLAQAGLEREEAERLGRWAEGSPGLALSWRSSGVEALRALLERALDPAAACLELAADAWEVEGRFAGATPTARARERARLVLDLALAVLRDAWRAVNGVAADELAHGDLVGRAAREPWRDPKELERRIQTLFECRADVERNLAPEALLDRAFLAFGCRDSILAR